MSRSIPNIFLIVVVLLVVILLFYTLRSKGSSEGWYYDPRRMCILGESSYPEYWAEQYGKEGGNYPYRYKIDEYNKQPTYCGGCWSTPSPVSMFAPERGV